MIVKEDEYRENIIKDLAFEVICVLPGTEGNQVQRVKVTL